MSTVRGYWQSRYARHIRLTWRLVLDCVARGWRGVDLPSAMRAVIGQPVWGRDYGQMGGQLLPPYVINNVVPGLWPIVRIRSPVASTYVVILPQMQKGFIGSCSAATLLGVDYSVVRILRYTNAVKWPDARSRIEGYKGCHTLSVWRHMASNLHFLVALASVSIQKQAYCVLTYL